MAPSIDTNGQPVFYDGNRIGQTGVELDTGNIILAMWKPLFRIKDSYSLTCGVFDQIPEEVRFFYVTDTDSGDVYKFEKETYYNAPIFHMNSQRQYVPKRSENIGYWEDAEEEIFG